MKRIRLVIAIAMSLIGLSWTSSVAGNVVIYGFQSELTSGQLAGTQFSGHFKFDEAGSTGVGQEFLNLTELDFTLEGIVFTRADLSQGGQAIIDDGKLAYFTAAFFPPPPINSPVNSIAFGFGGPGVIGYIGTLGSSGSGSYAITSTPVPEPTSALLVSLGSILIFGAVRRSRSCATRIR